MPKLEETHRYLIAGFAVMTAFCLLVYFAPFVVIFGFVLLFFTLMSLAVGYLIIDTYDMWRKDNDKNKSRKKAPPSKNVTQDERFY